MLEQLAFASQQRVTPPLRIAEWLSSLSDKQHTKLASWGLVEPRLTAPVPKSDNLTVDAWLTKYLSRGGWKPGTLEQLERTADNLREFFGNDRQLKSINCGGAEDFRVWLETKAKQVGEGEPPAGLAKNTVRRRIGRAKQIFGNAVKHKLISENPFADEVAATGANEDKHRFIPHAWIEKCIAQAPCEDWRVIIALARYGGLRSHETRIQRWADIDLVNRKMIVRSNKNPPTRVVPIFPELLPHLMRAREMAPPGAEFVQTRYGHTDNILTTFGKIIDAAGLTRWPDLMQNLRRSRETELMAKYPIKDVAKWIGNSVPVAMRHYAMAMQDSFTRAVVEGAGELRISRQISHQSATAIEGQASATDTPTPRNTNKISPLHITEGLSSYPART
ncbi:phage integrase SAM-like domain-containing protein [Roseiconus lacunae]|uniref:tyrosine-type recombinase/integrase n=1 Tax=Roseiconus lacunae TaxID=2605694 RepID=UPI00308993A3|nr:phage integrase SAM-like domain-containing protein [Stieleria sp. HD01]